MTTATDELRLCAAALGDPTGPDGLYRAVQASLGRLIGHRLFTLLITIEGGAEVERVWSSDEASYPLTGRKRMGPTPWGDHVLRSRRPWLGDGAEAIRWAFPDHALIASLGLACCINVPVVAFGRTLGTMNLLDREGAYGPADVEAASLFAPVLAAPFLLAGSARAAVAAGIG